MSIPYSLIGKQGWFALGNTSKGKGHGELQIAVRIKDVRASFGRVDLLVTPIEGDGQMWVAGSRVFMTRV